MLRRKFNAYANAEPSECQYVDQGDERISSIKPQYSRGFLQCHALLLINAEDGVTLLKHVGPTAGDVVFGDTGKGTHFQDKFKLFKEHAEKHGKRVIVQQAFGGLSVERPHLVEEVMGWCREKGIKLEVAKPIKVPSGRNYGWNIFYEPRRGEVGVEYRKTKDKFAHKTYRIPGLDCDGFAATNQEMEQTLSNLALKAKIKSDISGHVVVGRIPELEKLLTDTRDQRGEAFVHELLSEDLADYDRRTARKQCEWWFEEVSKRKNSDIKSEKTIEILDLISRFDKQDQDTRYGYAYSFLNILEEAKRKDWQDLAASYARKHIAALGEYDGADSIIKRIDRILEIRDEECAEKLRTLEVYLWEQIGKGQAPGHTRERFDERMAENGLTLKDIGATEADVEKAFAVGSFLEAARNVPSRFGQGEITEAQMNNELDRMQAEGLEKHGVDMRKIVALSEFSLNMYREWHAEKRAEKSKKAPKPS